MSSRHYVYTTPDMFESVKEISSKAEFDALISSTPFVAIHAHATYSGPSHVMVPHFAKLAHQLTIPGKYVFAKFDVESATGPAPALGIRGTPAFSFFENGEESQAAYGFSGAQLGMLEKNMRVLSSKASA
jgi:thioredoxin 1